MCDVFLVIYLTIHYMLYKGNNKNSFKKSLNPSPFLISEIFMVTGFGFTSISPIYKTKTAHKDYKLNTTIRKIRQ
jgi:hypothetical protein